MDSIFGITGKDFVMIASDKAVVQSIIKMQDDDNKLISLPDSKIMGTAADVSIRKDFTRLIKANISLASIKYNQNLLTSEVANFTRNTIWESLRTRNAYQAPTLIAGMDDGEPSLYLIEQLGGMERVTRGAIGYCSHFLYGLMDSCYKNDLSKEEAEECIKKCISELKTRFLMNLVNFDVKIIDSNGVTDISSNFN